MDERHDVVVIGGSAAGLSGAVALARFRRSVLVIDAGDPRNAPAGHVHNFLTRDGTPPGDIYAAGRAEATAYGARIESGRVTAVRREGDHFRVELDGRAVTARRVLVATGLRDELPDVPGLAKRWGIDVLHCPYCHGWEVRDQRVGVLATGPMAVHQALLFRQLTTRVTVFQHTAPALSDEELEQLATLDIPVVDDTVVEVVADATSLTGVRLADGSHVDLDALVVSPRMLARAEVLAPLGLQPSDLVVGDQVIGTQIDADATGATDVPGVWVAGNVATMQAQVISAAAAGLTAGAAINADLVHEDTERAVAARRHEQIHGKEAWDERYRAQPQHWSGQPNPSLVAEVADLKPGTALEAGAGEGADAHWLAERGWQVTAVDLSTVAMEKAAAQAEQRGLDVTWRQLDLTAEPAPGTYDLVTSHYLHLPAEPRAAMLAHLAAAVAPGGTLLVVGHDITDLDTAIPRPGLEDMWWSADDIAATLDDGWTVEVAEARPRPARDPAGAEHTVRDTVLRARRTGANGSFEGIGMP